MSGSGQDPLLEALSAGLVEGEDFRLALDAGYEAYCRRQALNLLSLVPREAIRPLYRLAREAALGGRFAPGSIEDPLDVLLSFCRSLLPLPPIDVWAEDLGSHLSSHLDDADLVSVPFGPIDVEVRRFREGEVLWRAILNLRSDGDAWRGSIAFHRGDDGIERRTGEIFREARAHQVLDRFLSLDDDTLRAFLRSLIP